jgi:hypothetical protein
LINTTATYTDVQVEATVINTGNNANGASLICRHSAEGWYEFTVSNAGLYTISAYDGVGGTGLVPGYNELAAGGSPAIKSGKSTNVYRAVCAGNELSLYVNDTLVKTVTDTNFDFTEGAVGIGASSPQQLPVDLIFQSFTVSQP